MVQPVSSDACLSLISGVLPIAWTTSLLNFMSMEIPVCFLDAGEPRGAAGAHKPTAGRGSYPDFANTTCRTSIFPDRNPASQYDK